jgi:glycosyltransferase involved in cell wall biosynthesis
LTPRNDVAIYAPGASAYYERREGADSGAPFGGGGAELQTSQLAAQLAKRGLSVAHIVFPVARSIDLEPGLELIARPRPAAGRLAGLREAFHVWRALRDADARLYVLRGGGSTVMLAGATFSLLHRRRLLHSVSNDFDLITRGDRSRLGQALSRFARRRADRVVVQTRQQARLAREGGFDDDRVSLVPSFAQPAPPAHETDPESFLWVGRVVPYKLPGRYLELARALPEARFRMIAVETAEAPQELMLEIAAAESELSNLEVLPRQWRETVLELIERATAVVVTSEYEGMPNVFLEAWSREVPVLTLHFDPDRTIADKGLGVAAEGSWERFVNGARRLWTDAGFRAESGERAREHVASVHSPDAIAESWLEIARESLSS